MHSRDRAWVNEQIERGLVEAVARATFKTIIVGRCGFCGFSVEAGFQRHTTWQSFTMMREEPRCQQCKAVVAPALPMLDRRKEQRPE